ncbi:MAG: hypothetical protein H0U89_00855 [Acidimicrobiia bacterium]|nr:hypothetical protein [Acidimicrobiia bacterium]
MPSDRTFVTELATGLGMVGDGDIAAVLLRRPGVLANLTEEEWGRLRELWCSGAYGADFLAGYRNGVAFLEAPDGLHGRRPRIVEWTGRRRAPGDEAVPSDLRIDHVYLVSCKYLSRILHNPSPARLVEGLLTRAPVDDTSDWYQRVAPAEHQELYEACAAAGDELLLPQAVADLSRAQRRQLAHRLRGSWPAAAVEPYARLCRVVSERAAQAWAARLGGGDPEAMVWRLLRIGSAPYFILGTSPQGAMRLRIDTPWDWRQAYQLRHFEVAPQAGGQPRVSWAATYLVRRTSVERVVRGHIEIRWSHGRFGQPPEAKVYLDSRHEDVPGYHAL